MKVNNVFHGIGVRCLIETVAFEPSEDILRGVLGESEMELTPSI